MERKFFCEYCKAEVPDPIQLDVKVRTDLYCNNCELIHFCGPDCFQKIEESHREICLRRKIDVDKAWDIEITSTAKEVEAGKYRLKLAYDMLELAEERQDYWSHLVALSDFENALYSIDDKNFYLNARGFSEYPGIFNLFNFFQIK